MDRTRLIGAILVTVCSTALALYLYSIYTPQLLATYIVVGTIIFLVGFVSAVTFVPKMEWMRGWVTIGVVVIIVIISFNLVSWAIDSSYNYMRTHPGAGPLGDRTYSSPAPAEAQKFPVPSQEPYAKPEDIRRLVKENQAYTSPREGKGYLYYNGQFHLITDGRGVTSWALLPSHIPPEMFGDPVPSVDGKPVPPPNTLVEGTAYFYPNDQQITVYLYTGGKLRKVKDPENYVAHAMPDWVNSSHFGPPLE